MIKRVSLFLICFCLRSWLMAMPSDTSVYNIRQYTDENGLPQNSIKSIAPDEYGFLWFATENGLVRFDGREFKVFSNQGSVNSTKRYVGIIPHQNGDLYAVNAANELMCISQRTAIPTHLRYTDLLLYPHFDKKSVSIAYGLEHKPMLRSRWDGYLIPASIAKLFFITTDSVQFYVDRKHVGTARLKEAIYYRNFFTLNNQLYYLQENGSCKQVRRDTIENITVDGLIKGTPFKIYRNYVSRQVFICQNNNLYIVEQLSNNSLKLRHLVSSFDFEEHSICAVYYDTVRQRLFLGSQAQGLFIIERCKFRSIISGAKAKDEVYYAQTAFSYDKLITGKGRIIGTDGAIVNLPLITENSDNYCIVKDHTGNIWTKNSFNVSCFSGDGKRILKQWELPLPVTALAETPRGKIWVGTKGNGIYELSLEQNEPRLVTAFLRDVNYIAFDKGLIWIAADEGLCRYYTGIDKVDVIKGTERKYIRSIYTPGDNSVWFTAADEGVFLYKYGKLHHIPLDNKQYLSSAHCILEDSNGYFWIPTNKGLFQASKQDMLSYAYKKQDNIFYMYYSKESGFNTNEFNGGGQPSGVKLDNGYFSFPSLYGIVLFKPTDTKPEFPDSSIYIDKIEVDGASVRLNDTLKLHASFERINIMLSVLYFGNPHNLDVDFQIQERFNGKWIQLGDNNIISYTTLPAGTYHLVIRKQNGFGPSNYSYRTLVIIVPAPFYKTWYFLIVLLVCLVFITYAYLWWRLHYTNRKNNILEERIAARTSELNEIVSALQNSEEALQKQTYLQQRMIAAITHDVKSPLKYLAITAKSLFDKLQKKESEESLADSADVIYSTSNSMLQFVGNLLDYIKGYHYNSTITEYFNLSDLVDEKIVLFSEIAELHNDAIYNEVDKDIFISANKQILAVIIHNLLDNAVKYTRNGSIYVLQRQQDDFFEIIVKDDGVGISEQLQRRYNADAANETSGLGLRIVLDLLKLIDGNMKIASRMGEGTTVTIRLDKRIMD